MLRKQLARGIHFALLAQGNQFGVLQARSGSTKYRFQVRIIRTARDSRAQDLRLICFCQARRYAYDGKTIQRRWLEDLVI
jgi:hypothetical protein